MAYDQTLCERVRVALTRLGCDAVERKMFGGIIAFPVRGHMCCGVANSDIVLRLSGKCVAQAIQQGRRARPMDFTDKPIKSMVYVEGTICDQALFEWIEEAVSFVRTLPAK